MIRDVDVTIPCGLARRGQSRQVGKLHSDVGRAAAAATWPAALPPAVKKIPKYVLLINGVKEMIYY